MTDKAIRLVAAVLSTCQTEDETEADIALLKAINSLKSELSKGWDVCYAYGGEWVVPNSGKEAQLQLRLTTVEDDFFQHVITEK